MRKKIQGIKFIKTRRKKPHLNHSEDLSSKKPITSPLVKYAIILEENIQIAIEYAKIYFNKTENDFLTFVTKTL